MADTTDHKPAVVEAQAGGPEQKKDKLIDVYVRLNDDAEKDYCFCLPRDEPVSALFNIFDTLPLVLSPTFFYRRRPVGFHLSSSPGFVTTEGALLFHHKGKQPPIADNSRTIGQLAREGQLFIPIFKPNRARWLAVVTVLLVWLYTDLPDWATPTPGISLFHLSAKAYDHFFADDTGSASIGTTGTDQTEQSTDGVIDVVFFLFHVIKVAVIFLIFFLGGYNPSSLNPFSETADVTPEGLRSIGWTGARRITPDEWREENRTRKIEEAGGAVKAYEQGILLKLTTAGVFLQPGEGWDTPADWKPSPSPAVAHEPELIDSPATTTIAVEQTETVIQEGGETIITESTQVISDSTTPSTYPADEFANIDIESPLVASPEVSQKYELRKKLDYRPDLYSKKSQ
ncbi:glucose signaling factor 2-domain-containing protein [Lipomyces japonicus]|uniref:glucose signaling factor 2-domain-containing protein n=1 Tax=Lipomyces japonicus TaxID=56871 RepID=UPI0034CFE7A1